MWRCSNDLIPIVFYSIDTICDTIEGIDVNPFLCAHRDFFINTFAVALLDNIQFLDSKNLATTHYSTRIVHLKNIFNHNRKMIGSVLQHFQKFFFAVFGKDVFEKIEVIDVDHILKIYLPKILKKITFK